jgi:hypothetical protein
VGIGIEDTLEAIVQRIPPPTNHTSDPLRALIFDSYYDPYRWGGWGVGGGGWGVMGGWGWGGGCWGGGAAGARWRGQQAVEWTGDCGLDGRPAQPTPVPRPPPLSPSRGVVCQFRVMDGSVSRGDTVVMMNTGKEYTLDEIGVLAPSKVPVSHCHSVRARREPRPDKRSADALRQPPPRPAALPGPSPARPLNPLPPLRYPQQVDTLYAGEVGYLAAQIKSVQDARVGDTVTLKKTPAPSALSGYEDVQPMVYCGLFPTDADDYQVGVGEERGRSALGVEWEARPGYRGMHGGVPGAGHSLTPLGALPSHSPPLLPPPPEPPRGAGQAAAERRGAQV